MNLTVTGNPTPEELAAVVALLATTGGEAEEPPAPAQSAWNDRAALLRQPLRRGPGAWRASR
jgi:hypothetical protein